MIPLSSGGALLENAGELFASRTIVRESVQADPTLLTDFPDMVVAQRLLDNNAFLTERLAKIGPLGSVEVILETRIFDAVVIALAYAAVKGEDPIAAKYAESMMDSLLNRLSPTRKPVCQRPSYK